jgi:hypothetical protein
VTRAIFVVVRKKFHARLKKNFARIGNDHSSRAQDILISPISFQLQCSRDNNVIVQKSFCARARVKSASCVVITESTRARTPFVKWSRCFSCCALVIERAVRVDSRSH